MANVHTRPSFESKAGIGMTPPFCQGGSLVQMSLDEGGNSEWTVLGSTIRVV